MSFRRSFACVLLFSLLVGCGSGIVNDDPVININLGGRIGVIRDGMLGVNAGPHFLNGTGNCPDASKVDFTANYQEAGVTSIRMFDMNGPMDMDVMWKPTVHPLIPGDFNWDGNKWTTWYECSRSSKAYGAHHDSNSAFQKVIDGGFVPYLTLADSYKYAPYEKKTLDLTDSNARARYVMATTTVVKHFFNNIVGTFKGYNSYAGNGYVEIWNEPNKKEFWDVAYKPQDFFPVYCDIASSLKGLFPYLKIGGPAVSPAAYLASGDTYAEEFITYVSTNCEDSFDFFSFHMYSDDPKDFTGAANHYRTLLEAKFSDKEVELHLTEFNASVTNRGSVAAGLDMTAAWIALQKQREIHIAHFYRGAIRHTNDMTGENYGLFYEGKSKMIHTTPVGNAFGLWSEMDGFDELIVAEPYFGPGYTGSRNVDLLIGQQPSTTNFKLLIVNRDTKLSGMYQIIQDGCSATKVKISELDSTGTTTTNTTPKFPGIYILPASSIHLVEFTC